MCFVMYSVTGYVWEVFYCSLVSRKFRNRGFLTGPYLPLWGFGAVILLTLQSWLNCTEWWQIFLMTAAICDTLEYVTSYALEKIFHLRWWDYTDNTRLSLNGRISLDTTIAFGVGGLILLQFIQPGFRAVIDFLPFWLEAMIAAVALAVMLADTMMSSKIAWQARKVFGKNGFKNIDVTSELKKLIRR